MKKNTVALKVLPLVAAFALVGCGNKDNDEKVSFNYDPDYSFVTGDLSGKTLKVGAILIGDQTEGYSEAHIKGIEKAKEVLEAKGASVNVSWEYKVSEDAPTVKAKVESLVGANNNIIITNSYNHQDAFKEGQFDASSKPEIDFISMTGDIACLQKKANYHNAFNATYQSRYASGYVAGLKLKELVDGGKLKDENKDANGNIKLGYVGAFPFAEVVSGYTGFYLGVKSVVSNVVMSVKYTSSWWDHDAEKQAASDLINQGAVIVSEHADSTGAPEACEAAFKQGKVVYNVGYNVSMIDAAPSCSLTSATNDWSVYYTTAFYDKLMGQPIPQDWAAGYEKGAVALTKINYGCFDAKQDDVDAKVKAVVDKLHDGSLKVFDCSKFTVGGQNISEYTITDDWSTVKGTQCIKTAGSVKYFDESNTEVRSAPYFDIRIDGITELNNN